ncbi:MAG: urea transporter [Planctomycetes bacterium]|nr:urea transporter [Planctomycetota bacterium]
MAAETRLRSDDLHRAIFTGYGALFLAPSVPAGALLLLATFALSPTVGTAVLIGVFVSTAFAHALRRDPAQIEGGLYGFSGALAAFALFASSAPTELLFALVPPAAALATWVQIRLIDGWWVRRLAVAPLSLAALAVGFPIAWLLARFGGYEPWPSAMLPANLVSFDGLFAPDFYADEIRSALAPGWREWPAFALILAAFAVHSRRTLVLLLVGTALGALVGFVFLGWYGALCGSFVLITAAPTFVALGGIFATGGVRAWIYATLGVVVAFFAWLALGLVLREAQLPLLTLPFWVTTTLFLLVLRFAPSTRFLPELVPLHQIGTSESAERWAAGRRFGWRYWQSLAQKDLVRAAAAHDVEELARSRALVAGARRIVAITGAGLSTESGIPDYRTGAIAWKQYDTAHFRWERFLASEESRAKYWEMSQDFYLVLRGAEPNPAHRFFAELAARGKLHRVITQNVDRLHQRAGLDDERVIEIHGNEHAVACLQCRSRFDRGEVFRWIQGGVPVPYCPRCQGILKPDSIAFDQPMPDGPSLDALDAVRECDLVIVAGTSLEVQPIASLPLVALRAGKPLLIVNLQPTDYDPFASAVLRGRVGELLPKLLA